MKPFSVLRFALLAFLVPALAAVYQQSPVNRVVNLIRELKAGLKGDARMAQMSYDKYACWCEATLARKAKNISDAKATLERVEVSIPELAAQVASHGAEIQQLKKDIAANEEAQREATEVRQTQNAEFEGEKIESENCIGALEAAIKTLSGAGTGKSRGFLETMREAQLLSVAASLRQVISKEPVARSTSEQDLEALRQFVAQPSDFAAEVRGKAGNPLSAAQLSMTKSGQNPFGDYAPQSTRIQGILKGMYDAFAAELEKDNAAEAEKQKAFEELMATKQQELDTLKGTLQMHVSDKANKAKQLADDKTEREDTAAQLEADTTFFENTKAGCKAKAEEWAVLSRLQTEELQGIDQALEILTSPEAQQVFLNSSTTLLQLSSSRSGAASDRGAAGSRSARAYSKLQALAAEYHSLDVARIAVQARNGGHFDKVMVMIDHMVAALRKEEAQDIEHRDRCQSGETKNSQDMEDLTHSQAKTASEIARLEGLMAGLSKKIADFETDIGKTKEELQEMLTMRNEEHAEFAQALKDDSAAIKIIESAISSLAKFYKNNRIAMAFLQGKRHMEDVVDSPEYTIDPDKAPEAPSADYTGKQTETKGVLSALEMIVEDIKNEITTSRKEEAAMEAQYKENRASLEEVLLSLEKGKVESEARLADLGEKKADKEAFHQQAGAELAGQQELQVTLNRDCSWVAEYFESRRAKRKTEIEGLQEAKSILAGVDAGDYDTLAVATASN